VDRGGQRPRSCLKDRAARSRDSSRDRRRVLPRAPLQPHRRLSDDDDDDTGSSSVIRDVATEINRMTSSVNNLDDQPLDRPFHLDTSSTDRHSGVRGATSQSKDVGRLAMSTSDLASYSSTSSALRIHERLQEQKRKKTETRRGGLDGGRGGEPTLLAQIQDDLQSEINRYGAQLGSGTPRPISRSVVCEEDLNSSASETGNIVNTALIDSQVYANYCYVC